MAYTKAKYNVYALVEILDSLRLAVLQEVTCVLIKNESKMLERRWKVKLKEIRMRIVYMWCVQTQSFSRTCDQGN